MGMIGEFLIVVNNCSKNYANKKAYDSRVIRFLQVATGEISPANRQETRFY